MEEKITYKRLSNWLKVLVVFGFISLAYNILMFIVGFVEGYTGI